MSRFSMALAALLMVIATSASADTNIFDAAMKSKPWVRASVLATPGTVHTLRPVLSAGLGYKIDKKMSATLQYRVILGAPNQIELGLTRAIW